MLKKSIFSFGVLMVGFGGISIFQPLSASPVVSYLDNEISNYEKMMVCCELADQKVLDLDTSLEMLRAGQLTITKIDSGVYQVNYGGNALILVLEDNNI